MCTIFQSNKIDKPSILDIHKCLMVKNNIR